MLAWAEERATAEEGEEEEEEETFVVDADADADDALDSEGERSSTTVMSRDADGRCCASTVAVAATR